MSYVEIVVCKRVAISITTIRKKSLKTAASVSEICANSYENRSNDGRAVVRPLAAAKSAYIQRLA